MMNAELTELTLEEMDSETGVNKAEECLADYWVCRNKLLDEYGEDHFFDLDQVIPEESLRKLDYLMNRYIEEVKKNERGAA